jgi:hypothetical protein
MSELQHAILNALAYTVATGWLVLACWAIGNARRKRRARMDRRMALIDSAIERAEQDRSQVRLELVEPGREW